MFTYVNKLCSRRKSFSAPVLISVESDMVDS